MLKPPLAFPTLPSLSRPARILLGVLGLVLAGCVAQEDDAPIAVATLDVQGRPILVHDVAIFDSAALETVPGRDVLIRGGSIVSVTPTRALDGGNSVHVIPGNGATLIPGLVDMHGHLTTTTGPTWASAAANPESNLLAYAYAGVTTIFDPGDSSDEAFSRRERVSSGELVGPRIFTAGKILTHPDGHPRTLVEAFAPGWIAWLLKDGVATGVSTPQEARAEVDARADSGVDAIKVVVDSIPLEADILARPVLASIIERARERGLRTVAHIGTTEDAITAAENGVALWVHGVYKERIPDAKIATIASFGIPMVTTSEVFDRYGRAMAGPIEPTILESETVSDHKLESFYPPPEDFDLGDLEGWLTLMQDTREVRLDNVGRLHRAGVTILAGSDTQSGVFPGAGLHRELATLVAAGLTPAEALRAATLDPARYLEQSDDPLSGIIAPGKRADLVLVNGDPTADIAVASDIREVILNGRLLARQSLK